ncbi:MAG: hypothetical protein GY754_03100 [bacterium]|nr:hypothetical protein [bacterium]
MITTEIKNIIKDLNAIYAMKKPPGIDVMMPLVEETVSVLSREDRRVRPPDSMGLPGGLLYLDDHKNTIIVPDIHARLNLLLSLVCHNMGNRVSVLERLYQGDLQIVCVGDGMHAESRAYKRWLAARGEFEKGFKRHGHMDEEMYESLGAMAIVFILKCSFPDSFHYLKGNHDNIANESGNGNHPFIKFAYEGPMVTEYLQSFYGMELMECYAEFERNLPLLAVGKNFMISHSEPVTFFSQEAVVNYREYPEVVEGLTWTDDDVAEQGSVETMLYEYIESEYHNSCYYFGGHRPVKGLYNTRSHGRYIQIHNPNKLVIAKIDPEKPIQLDEDIIEIDDIIKRTAKG